MSTKKGRSYEKNFDVAVPVEDVWKAITEGNELTRWFCSEATCEPGVGGRHQIDWGGGAKATHTVTVWEPNAHLRTESDRGISGPESTDPQEPYAVDWFLEHSGGVTRVRMVASGFGEGPEWDHEYDGTFHGWDMFHKTLKHYLEHHRGEASANVVLYAMLSVPPEEAWNRLMGPEGLVREGSADALAAGASFHFVTCNGDILAGVVLHHAPGNTFSAMVESLNKAILNIEMCSIPGQGRFLYLSLNTWGLARADVDALGSRLKAIVYGLFPQQTGAPASSGAPSESETAKA